MSSSSVNEQKPSEHFSDLFKSDEEELKKSEIENEKKSDSTQIQVVASNDKKVDKNLREEQTEIFKQEKPKDEKRILDFFTKFFASRRWISTAGIISMYLNNPVLPINVIDDWFLDNASYKEKILFESFVWTG